MGGMKFVILGFVLVAFYVSTGISQNGYQPESDPAVIDSSFQIEKAIALTANEHFDDALVIMDKLVAKNSDNSMILAIRGIMLRKASRFEEAMADLNNAIKLDPNNAAAYCHRAFCAQQAGESNWWEQAIADTGKSIAIESKTALPYLIRGNAFAAIERFEEAIGSYDSAIALNPNSSNSFLGRAQAYAELGKFEEAKADLKKAFSLPVGQIDNVARETTAIYVNALIDAGN